MCYETTPDRALSAGLQLLDKACAQPVREFRTTKKVETVDEARAYLAECRENFAAIPAHLKACGSLKEFLDNLPEDDGREGRELLAAMLEEMSGWMRRRGLFASSNEVMAMAKT